MKTFPKPLAFFFVLIGLLLLGTGCGGKKGGGGGGSGTKDAELKQAITARINSFKTAVEAYDVEGMLDFLYNTGSKEQLTIAEEGVGSCSKDYTTLETEVREDEGKERHWRKSPAEGGNGYTLTMKLSTITFSNIKESGAYAVVPFEIKEAAENPSIPPITTDHGHMTCEMVKIQGTWRCQKLTINFYTLNNAPSGGKNALTLASYIGGRGKGSKTKGTRGFSFGSFVFE